MDARYVEHALHTMPGSPSQLEGARWSVRSTYTDVSSEQTALANANANRENARANVFTAAASLAFATGTIQTNATGTTKP